MNLYSKRLSQSSVTFEQCCSNHKCFEQTKHLLRQCTEQDKNKVNPVLVAIVFTMCDMETGHLKILQKCESLDSSQTLCVEAISRSPQLWASYASHLQRIENECFQWLKKFYVWDARNNYRQASKEKLWILNVFQNPKPFS